MHHPSTTAASRLRHALLGTVALAGLLAAGTAGAQTTTADPMRDPRYMSGHRDATPPEIPEEFRDADALTRVKGVKRITACADPYAFPSTEITDVARGFDVDILKAIAKEQGWETFFIWVNTSGRGGMNRAFRTSIKKGICDVFLGLGTGGLDPELGKSRLKLLDPVFGVGYVLVSYDPALKTKTLDELAAAKVRAAATYFTESENFLTKHAIDHETFPESRRAIRALAEGKVQIALIPSTMIAEAQREFPDRALVILDGYQSKDGLTWNNTWAAKEKETELNAFLNQRIAALAADGRLKSILGTYGIPYYPPFPQ